jgi:RimJ/RimL family protein N-acetyltransferase
MASLTGEFVNLRPLCVDDAALTLAWRRSERSVNLNQGAQTLEDQARWIERRPADEYNFIIERKDLRPIGMLSLTAIDKVNRRAEPGRFLIGDEAGAVGIPAAVEAMKLLYELAFDQLKLVRVYGTVAADNPRMLKWQIFMGMVKEGVLRSHYFINGHFQDAIVLGLLENEYRAKALPRLNALIAPGRSSAQSFN